MGKDFICSKCGHEWVGSEKDLCPKCSSDNISEIHGREVDVVEWKNYIGTSVVSAHPCIKKDMPKEILRIQNELNINPGVEGDEHTYTNGYVIFHEDGYISWLPKGTFDRSFRAITDEEKNLIK